MVPSWQQQIYAITSTVAKGSADHGRKRFNVNLVPSTPLLSAKSANQLNVDLGGHHCTRCAGGGVHDPSVISTIGQ